MPQFFVLYFGWTVLHTRLLSSAWRPQWRTFNFLMCNNGSHYHDRIWLSGKCAEQRNNCLGTNKNIYICSCSVFLGGAAKSSTDPVREKKMGPVRGRKCTDRKWELWCPHTALNATMMLEKVSSSATRFIQTSKVKTCRTQGLSLSILSMSGPAFALPVGSLSHWYDKVRGLSPPLLPGENRLTMLHRARQHI